MNENYYHVTTKEAWENKIMQDGLIPLIGERSEEFGEEVPRIYLFTSYEAYEDGMLLWLGEAFEDDQELVLLKVELPFHEYEEFMESEAGYEVAVLKTIGKESVTLVETL